MALRLGAHITTADTEYGTVLLDQRSGEYWELNPTGTLILRTLLDGGDEQDATDALIAEFDIDRSRGSKDVTELLTQLRSCGLVS
ncbi:lasso peptide biosynthesis PqqD family chaperone [Streptomyces natalensis]|uniref:Lasso peptide biosynthesis PqqD family chaperone n=1 Tax=Streptomyces natalensis ATCC 27448 TaxID=1240678 RepID=A0A0D7CJY2_9ACTN|nr:lasso peptide biosynthesis PqqD family chaperone [Streptomyces natalensis]KIZ16544.1 hypothetical protein SNA_19735 [Streptomyces natalensis ATCC 27448]